MPAASARCWLWAADCRCWPHLPKPCWNGSDPAADKPRHVEDFALDKAGLQRPLRDGDILTLFEISPQFANAVTLRGNVAAPLRYPFTEGMRVRDLIPDREALITPDYYQRKNLLVQF